MASTRHRRLNQPGGEAIRGLQRHRRRLPVDDVQGRGGTLRTRRGLEDEQKDDNTSREMARRMKVLLEGFRGMSLEIVETLLVLGLGVCVGGIVGNRSGLVIEPSGLSLMLRSSKGTLMEVVAVAEGYSAIGDGEDGERFGGGLRILVVGFEEDSGGLWSES
ncbi:unnamed protein product [Citrullus colocynthis]|uniref:Uncharacterized protein n=1 Tax=Citrullus colocynthis TaxID=252529 RepID=A0ABP0YET9_9ROSI